MEKKEVVDIHKLNQDSKLQKKQHILHIIKHHVSNFHKIRKKKEENLPKWKQKWHDWNEKYFHWLEHLVEVLIPYLVILILVILFGEFADELNFFNWQFMTDIAVLFEKRAFVIDFVDNFVVAFFIIDLYFNFFKKRTFWNFLKTSFLDIIAIIPLGIMFRLAEISDIQGLVHIITGVEKEVKAAELIEKEISTGTKIVSRVPKIARLNRLAEIGKFERIIDESKKKKNKK